MDIPAAPIPTYTNGHIDGNSASDRSHQAEGVEWVMIDRWIAA
jgi:hypothetical protein